MQPIVYGCSHSVGVLEALVLENKRHARFMSKYGTNRASSLLLVCIKRALALRKLISTISAYLWALHYITNWLHTFYTESRIYIRLIAMKIAVCLLFGAFLGLELCFAAPLTNTTANHLSTACSCKKRSQQYLTNLFSTVNNANCFSLETLPALHSVQTNSQEQNSTSESNTGSHFSILSGYTRCLIGYRQIKQCFNPQSQCSWAQDIRRTAYGLFPQFELHVTCRGCSEGDSTCLETHNSCYSRENRLSYLPLVREQRTCDQEGYEVWTPAVNSTQLTVACSCIRTDPVL